MKLNLFFHSSILQDSSIKCLNRADFGDQMKHLEISKKSTRSNIYLNLKITDVAFVCQNKVIPIENLCRDKETAAGFECETESKTIINL